MRFHRAARRAPYPLIAAIAFSCGPSPSGSAPSADAGAAPDAEVSATGPIPEALAPTAVAQAICDKVARCGCAWSTSAPCLNESVCSSSTCVAAFTRTYRAADVAAAATGRVYDPEGARKCTDAVAAAACLDVDYVNLCTVLWNGTQPLGGSCGATQACQTSDAAPAVCGAAGVCVAKASGAPPTGEPAGAACSGTCSGSSCVILFGASGGQCEHGEGLACVSGTCQSLRKQGDACSGKFACADPLTCVSGFCAARLPNGNPCTLTGDEDPCSVGSGCVAGVCATLKANGQACQSPVECLENRCFAGQCIREFANPICGA